MSKEYVHINEVMERLEVKEGTAYKIIQNLNKELKKKGYIAINGKIPRKFFNERCYIDDSTD